MPDRSSLPALEYHERTKHTPESVRSGPGLDFENQPSPDKHYLDRPRESVPDEGSPIETPALDAIAVDRRDPPGRPPFPGTEPTRLDRGRLAQLCYYSAGITKGIERRGRTIPFRAAACTGALYHVDLYPVCADLPGLEAGVYHYHPPTQSLDVLRRGDHRGWLAAATGDARVERAPVTVVATSTWWRNAWKYRARTFRHAFWDSGTVLANLLAVAHATGLPASIVTGFADDRVAELCGLDPAEEAPLELVPIGAGEPVPTVEPPEAIAPETAPLSPNPETYPDIVRAWRAGTLADADDAAAWRSTAVDAVPLGRADPGDGPRVALEPADSENPPEMPLDATVRRRGSCREYAREPIGFAQLSTVLDRAVRGLPLDVRPDDAPPLAVTDCYLIANAVDGLDSGVYHYHPGAHDLERLRTGAYRREAGRLALGQRLGADAAVCLYFLAGIEAIVETIGDRGYRVAQLEAAATAGRLYLATYAHRSLGGTGLTFFDDLVAAFFEPRARGQTPMFLYTVGRPA